jgi:Uma2 family endonuclease
MQDSPEMTAAGHRNGALPPLENGDRLTRHEFHRRYMAMPEVKKAELIEGRVYMPSPVRPEHASPHADIVTWLGVYRASTPGVQLADNATVRLDLDNEPQPDALLRLDLAQGGKSRISSDGYIEGAPELIVEVAASSAAYDLHEKRTTYRRNGVQEYLVWQVYDRRIDWWELREGAYEPLPVDQNSVICSRVFPGLYLDTSAMLSGNLAQVLATLQQHLGGKEHKVFVEKLAGALRDANS